MDDEERALFEGTLRRACESRGGADLDRALDELGWHEALRIEPRLAVSSLFEQLGAANTTASALDAVVGCALGNGPGPSLITVLPALGSWRPPGRVTGKRLVVGGVVTAAPNSASSASVVAASGEDTVVVEVAVSDLALRAVRGVDPRLGLVGMAGDGIPCEAPRRLGSGEWPTAVARAQLALGHQLVGASRAMLTLATDHALERVQFGRPIASFQAVRHRLAETLVATEAATAALDSAWTDGSPRSAAWAKALAGRSARTASRHCQQVLAGIGFTTEHDFHRYAGRVLVLDQLFGTSRGLTREAGRELLAGRRLPPLPPL